MVDPVLVRTIDSVAAPSDSYNSGACCTCSAICFVAFNPSPLAVTVIVAEPTFAVEDAVSVSVDVPLSPLSVTGLLLHPAVTPLGSPLRLRLAAPLYVPLPVRLTTSVTDLPCTTETGLEAAATVSAGAVSVTVIGTLALAAYAAPVFAVTFALRLSVADPAAAVELPVSVSVHTTAPVEFTLGELHEAVNPFGSPEATLMLDPAAPLAAVSPPTGTAVTVTLAVDRDCTATEVGEAASVIPAAC